MKKWSILNINKDQLIKICFKNKLMITKNKWKFYKSNIKNVIIINKKIKKLERRLKYCKGRLKKYKIKLVQINKIYKLLMINLKKQLIKILIQLKICLVIIHKHTKLINKNY